MIFQMLFIETRTHPPCLRSAVQGEIRERESHLDPTFIKKTIIIKHFWDLFVIYLVKKCFSILVLVVMVAAISHISVAIHYCGGEIVASKVSLTGQLASCGMESAERSLPVSKTIFKTHCCEDIVTYCGTDNNYTPTYSFLADSYQFNFQYISLHAESPVVRRTVLASQYKVISPPGVLMCTGVDLTDICIFRI